MQSIDSAHRMLRFPVWTFREMARSEINVDPVHDEFFKAQDLADALVRESVQNSLDARRPRATVRVRFRLRTGEEALPAEVAVPYFRDLHAHIAAVAREDPSLVLPREDDPVPLLIIEDGGTRGLTGDPAADPDLDAAVGDKGGDKSGDKSGEKSGKNDFYYFWRNVGRSSKGELDRGRWGLGKAVFPVASRIRTIFGLTLRDGDPRRLLLGQSVLKTHVINGRKHDPYGFFGRSERGLSLPIESDVHIDRFSADVGIDRGEPGLSIVVPYFRDDELTTEALVASTLRQYFYPITRGDLVVTVENGRQTETISSKTIDDVARRHLGDEGARTAALCDLTRWSLWIADEERIALRDAGSGAAPKWSDALLPAGSLDRLRDRFERSERLAFRVPVGVKRKRSKAAASWFDVILAKDEALPRPDLHFIRRGITIPEVKAATSVTRPVRALVVVDQEALSTLLGDAENPAHSDWSERADKVRGSYDRGAWTVRFVKNSIAQLSAMLTRPPAGRVRDLLAEIFSIDLPEEGEAPESGGGDGDDEQDGGAGQTAAIAKPASKGSRIRIARSPEGFTLRGAGDPGDVGRTVVAEVAYRLRSGNPFRRYSPFDFELGKDVTLQPDGIELREVAGNRIAFTPVTAAYTVAFHGFDRRRDLVVRVAVEGDLATETELH